MRMQGSRADGRRRWWVAAWWGACVLTLAACSARAPSTGPTGPGLYHQVQRGENLFRIGKAYGVSHLELARVNAIDDPNKLEVGQKVFVPGAKRALPVNVITPERVIDVPANLPKGEGVFIWPLANGSISSPFGYRGRQYHHDGIDISAPIGSVVRASRDGSVVYSDTLRGYGNVIIIEHENGYATVYAHNSENLVRAGTQVQQGQTIGTVGNTGRTTGPNLHFEIRKDNSVVNPIYFLPRETAQKTKGKAT